MTDELLRNLADLRSNGNIQPFPVIQVDKKRINGCDLVVIEVHPSLAPPVRFRGRTWVRVASSTRSATREDEQRLAEKRRSGDLPFDLSTISVASLEDLDTGYFRREYLPSAIAPEVLASNRRSGEDQLRSVRFLGKNGESCPTVVGMLVAGKEPRSFIPGAYVQFVRIHGTELTDPIQDQKEIGGTVSETLERLEEVLKAHLSVSTRIVGASREVQHPDYPLDALLQLTRNAVMHRNYEGTHAPVRVTWFRDRIEIQNPGGPFGQVTTQNFGEPGITDYRNPHLAEALKNLGYVQRFGFGIQLARQAMESNGNPPLEFKVEGSHVLAILRSAP